METNYKRTVAGSVGAGMASVFNASGRQYYILEHKTESLYHHAGESQKIIVDQIELGRDSACQVRFDESFETVSRRHAAIVKDDDGWKIISLSQTNPTFVNGVPIQGECKLSSGDEIRLSSRGPLMGFIVPQGKQSMVSSIGMTERLSLFRQQALRPYKTALWVMAIVLILAVGGLIAWNIYQSKQTEQVLQEKQAQIEAVKEDLNTSEQLILNLNQELIDSQQKSAAEQAAVKAALSKAKADRDRLIEHANQLNEDIQYALENADIAIESADKAKADAAELQKKLEEINAQKEAEKESEGLFQKKEDKSEGLFGKKK